MNSVTSRIFILLFFVCSFGNAQKIDSLLVNSRDITDILRELFKKKDTTQLNNKKVAYSFLPVPIDGTSNTGLIVSFMTSFYLGEDHEKTKMSQITFAPSFSFSNQYQFPIQSYVYTNENKYSFIGDYRFLIYPQPTFGLGTNNKSDEESVLNYKQWRFYQFATRQVYKSFRLGGGILIDNYQNLSEDKEIEGQTDYEKYMNGNYDDVNSLGLALQILSDTRENIINPSQGHYLEIDYRFNTNGGIDKKGWQSLYVDARKYHSFSEERHKVLAYRAFYWATFAGNPHYLDLPSIGWDRQGRTGRGFTRNRFRSTSLLYFEGEYRTDISRNGFLGAVFFSNISSVSELNKYWFEKWNPAVGTGLRLKWNKRNKTNVAVDFGISRNDWSLRLGLSENF